MDVGIPVRDLLAGGPGGQEQMRAIIDSILTHKKVRDTFRQPQVMAAIGG